MRRLQDRKGIPKYVLLLLALACVLIIRMIRIDDQFPRLFNDTTTNPKVASFYAKTTGTTNITGNNIPKVGDLFAPGSLDMTRLESIQKCYIDPKLYRHHFVVDHRFVSDEQKLVFVMVRKSGSTNTRAKLELYFNDTTDTKCKRGMREENARFYSKYQDYFVFGTSRDPISRYVSGFQEILHRWTIENERPEKFKKFAKEYIPRRMDHGGVLEALQSFLLHPETGRGPLADRHLSLQSTGLRPPDCPLKLDAIYEISEINNIFDTWLNQRNITRLKMKERKRYTHSVNITTSDIDSDALRKICQLTALDYCCLNYKLPTECEGVIQCRWVSPAAAIPLQNSADDLGLQIEAVSPYPAT